MDRRAGGGQLRRVVVATGLALAMAAGVVVAAAAGGGDGPRIAFLLPEAKTTRYEAKDRPYFEAHVARRCPDCRVLYANAGQNTARQLAQVEAALANAVDVVVLDAVDARAARGAVIRAEQAGVPVVAYDRLVDDPRVDWYVGFDNDAVGRLQAAALARAVAGRPGRVAMLHGARTDPNAAGYRNGAAGELRRRGVPILGEWWIEDWDPDRARHRVRQLVARHGAGALSGVYVANDTMAGAVIDALTDAGVTPLPPVTGQDAELEALRRILAGRQAMTVYKPLRLQARQAAEIAVAVVAGRRPPVETVPTGSARVPGVVLAPVAVGTGGWERIVHTDRFWTTVELCAGLEQECRAAGLDETVGEETALRRAPAGPSGAAR